MFGIKALLKFGTRFSLIIKDLYVKHVLYMYTFDLDLLQSYK